MTDLPVGRVLGLAFHQAALDDPVLRLIESDSGVMARVGDLYVVVLADELEQNRQQPQPPEQAFG